MIDGYISAGWQGRFVMLRKSGKYLLLAADFGKGLRISDEGTWRSVAKAIMFQGIWFLIGGLLLAILFIGIPIAIFGIALLVLSGTWVGVADFCAHLRSNGLPATTNTPTANTTPATQRAAA